MKFPIKEFTRAHLLQSGLAALFIFLAFLAMDQLKSGLTVASLGASTAIAFSFPNTNSARPRFLIGGYCVGAFSGITANLLGRWIGGIHLLGIAPHLICGGVAVFLTMLLMTTMNVEHPPSAALSVAVATAASPFVLAGAALAAMLVLCLVKWVLRNHLVNL